MFDRKNCEGQCVMKILLIVYGGNAREGGDGREASKAVEEKFPGADVRLVDKKELKDLGKRDMIRFLRDEVRDLLVIYCEDLKKENLILLKLIGLLTKARKRIVIDKKRQTLVVDPSKLLLVEFPLYIFLRGCVLVSIGLINCILGVLNLPAQVKRSKEIIVREGDGKLRIVYLRTNYEGLKPGGALSHVEGFAKGVMNLGSDISFISSSRIDALGGNNIPCYVIEPVSFLNKLCVEASQICFNFKFVFHAYNILKMVKADLLYHRSSTFNCSGTILSFLLRKPLVLEFNSSSLWKTEKNVKQRFKLTRFLMERLNLSWADRIIVVSEVSKGQLEEKGIDVRKIVVNPNGADPETFNPEVSKKNVREIYGLDNKLLVGFAGSLYQWHGLETLVGCVKNVTSKNGGVHFLIIGDGLLRNKLEKMAKEERTSNFITFTGVVPKAEMPAYLNACDVLVSPHRNMADGQTFFGSPVKIFEYMAMGKPIVASKVGQLEDLLQNGINALLVPPDDPEKLADAILRLASDANLRDSLSKKARSDLVGKYTWTDNAKRVIECLRK